MITKINEFRKINENEASEIDSRLDKEWNDLIAIYGEDKLNRYFTTGINGFKGSRLSPGNYSLDAIKQNLNSAFNMKSKVNEASGDYSTEEHAIASAISKNLETLVKDEVSGQLLNKSDENDIRNGLIKFEIADINNPGQFFEGQIVVEIFHTNKSK